MRCRSLPVAAVVAGLSLLSSWSARAQEDTTNVRAWPAERLEIATDTEGIINTRWAGIPDHFGMDVALLFGYENTPLFLFLPADQFSPVIDGERSPLQRKALLVEHRFIGDLSASIALFNWVQIGLDIPVLLAQSRNPDEQPEIDSGTPLGGFGVGDIRLDTKLRLLRQQDGMPMDLAVLLPVTVPTGQFADYFGESFFSFTPGIAASREWEATTGTLRGAVNVGHRFRDQTNTFGIVAGNELIARFGGAYVFKQLEEFPTEVGLSLNMALATDGGFRGTTGNAPVRNPVELLGEVQQKVFGPIDVFLGGGVGVIPGHGVPDFRAFGGVRYADRPPADYDNDGLVQPQDRCPKRAETKNGYLDDDGCPDAGDDDQDGFDNDTDKCRTDPEDKDGVEDGDGCPEDDDKDGVADAADACRKEPEDKDNFEDADGCPEVDNDKDGIEDDKDNCKEIAEDKDNFEDQDGCPEADNDKDTVADADDGCPNEPGPKGNKGCPDPDTDGDTLVDRLDNCPQEAGPPENGGCATKQLVIIREQKLEILDKIFFRTASDVIQKKSYGLLDNIVQVLKAHPEIKKVRIEGHTDNVGDDASNKSLSDRRAKSVRRYLVEKGIEEARLDAVGFGEEQPIATNDTDDGKGQNRRVEFMIVD